MADRIISREEERERIRQRINHNDAEEKQRIVIPAEETKSLADDTVQRRVCAYCRVSTDDPAQTTSYELQKKHYEKEINNTPGWVFAGIYADEGISGTSLKNRDEFNRMIADCYAGKIDVIVTKNVSRFARNVVDCLSVVRNLAKLNPPVGVKFENEGFYSLDATSELLLTVLAASAQEESKTKSNSMNWSLEKRFDNGNFLTPVLLGYDHDNDGNLIVNQYEANTVKLMFYSFLAGFSLAETAQLLNELGRPSKKGNVKWNASGVRSILKNERYCGDILSWKTYTYDFWEHKKRKNKKNRKQVLERDHHEAIVSHEIFDAVQVKLELDKYASDTHSFPTLDVVDGGILQGFVSVNRSCRGFTEQDYRDASESIYSRQERLHGDAAPKPPSDSFELDGYEIARAQFFAMTEKPVMSFSNRKVTFNSVCLKKFENVEYVELLINTVEKCIAIRPCAEDSPNAFRWGRMKEDRWRSTPRSISGFAAPLFAITGWDPADRIKLCGQYLTDGNTQMLLFDLSEPEIIRLVRQDIYNADEDLSAADVEHTDITYEGASGSCDHGDDDGSEPGDNEEIEVVRPEKIYPEEWNSSFGRSAADRLAWYYERIRYEGDWEILRPAKCFAIAGGVREDVLKEVQRETKSIIEEMRCAV